jgi:hypothetical protein
MDSQRLKKLQSAVAASRKKLGRFREEETLALKQYVGSHYGDNGADEPFPVNILEIAVTTLLQQLAAKEPQVLLLTRDPGLKATASETELAVNEMLLRMEFGDELRSYVMSALFSVGIMKVGIEPVFAADVDGETLVETDVFAQHVPFDDWVHDVTARKWCPEQVQFCGHKYRVPLDWVKKNKAFDEKARESVTAATTQSPFDSQRDDGTSTLAHGAGESFEDDFVEHVTLWDIWVPSEETMFTYSHDATELLTEVKLDDRRGHGPFHLLGFNPVLNNVMPLPPVANWVDAHDLDNRMFTKLGEQASRQKTVTYVTPAAIQTGQTVIKSEDGDSIITPNPGGVKEQRFGGPDQQTLGFAGYMRDMVSYLMGNVDSMAGLGQQAGTASQEKIIKESGNQRIQAMQGQVLKSVRKIVRDIFWWMWQSPTIQLEMVATVSGVEIPTTWPIQIDEFGQEMDLRDGLSADLFSVDIEPYSLQDKPPSQRLQELRMIWQQDIMPLVQMGQAQGDVEKYLAMLSKYGDWPEVTELAILPPSGGLPPVRGGGGSAQAGMSEREPSTADVQPGMTMRGAEREMMTAAMGAGQQNA